MERYTLPCLAHMEVRELARARPKNIWIQSMTVEAGRVAGRDPLQEVPGVSMFDVRRAYSGLYIPRQTIVFQTPLMKPVEGAYKWDDFMKQVGMADKVCLRYRYDGSSEPLTDDPFSDRLFIKHLELLEVPVDDPRYHEAPYYPQKEEDAFYDGVLCRYVTFEGTHQLLGAPVHAVRDGVLPGETRKPMDLVKIEVLKTKHVRTTEGHGTWRAYHRGKGSIHTETQKTIVQKPERVEGWLPTCCKEGLITKRIAEGNWKNLPRFEAVNLLYEGYEGAPPRRHHRRS